MQRVIGQGAEGRTGDQHQASYRTDPLLTDDVHVNHAATIINRFPVEQDGKTPMEKARGTTANREIG